MSSSTVSSDAAPSAKSPYQAPLESASLSRNELSLRFAAFFIITFLGCVADLASKHFVFAWLGLPSGAQNIYWLVEGYVGIETALNFGALFGMGQNMVWFFATMSFVALAGVGIWLTRYQAIKDWMLTVTLGLVTGGILGNLYDRLGLWSDFTVFAVRDWIRISYQDHVWPNFNIADSLLVCGAVLLFWHSLRNPHAKSETESETPLADAA